MIDLSPKGTLVSELNSTDVSFPRISEISLIPAHASLLRMMIVKQVLQM